MSNTINSPDAPGTYTVGDIANILGISLRKAYYLVDTTTDFRVLRLSGRCVRIPKSSFDAWFGGTTN